MNALFREARIQKAQRHIVRAHTGDIDIGENFLHRHQPLKVHVPDPADVLAVLRAVIQTRGKTNGSVRCVRKFST